MLQNSRKSDDMQHVRLMMMMMSMMVFVASYDSSTSIRWVRSWGSCSNATQLDLYSSTRCHRATRAYQHYKRS